MYVYTILGHAHSTAETINVTFKIANDIIFSGNIPVHPTTTNVQDCAAQEIIRWSSEIPLAGTLHVSGSVGDGDLFFAMISELKIVNDESELQQEYQVELEYPDDQANHHAVSNLVLNGVLQQPPVNANSLQGHNDIRGWHYYFPSNSTFEFNYFAGPFVDNS
jgi:hypothetical protein